jgi:endonuclease/exonuclease/phosphatase (EEP) superfamily protein YafD
VGGRARRADGLNMTGYAIVGGTKSDHNPVVATFSIER